MIYLHGLTDKHCSVSQSAKDESAVTQFVLLSLATLPNVMYLCDLVGFGAWV